MISQLVHFTNSLKNFKKNKIKTELQESIHHLKLITGVHTFTKHSKDILSANQT